MSEKKLSPVEGIKIESNYLRGEVAKELADGSDAFGKSSVQVLKHHGTYQQDDRDLRGVKREPGQPRKVYSMMVRTRVPGGKLTSAQLLGELAVGDELADSTLRITSRQGLQLHGVPKGNLKETIRRINQVKLTTLAACGDVSRNVMCCPAPFHSPIYEQTQKLADQLSEHLAPRTRAYYELWLRDLETGQAEQVDGGTGPEEVEPVYGRQYLPRKFKIGIAFPSDNCIDLLTNDLGFLAIVQDDQVIGYNVVVGGGMGVTPSNKKTFVALGQQMAYLTPEQVLPVATAVVRVQRDFGNREDRKLARMKYLVHNWGLEKFKAKVEEFCGLSLPAPKPVQITGHCQHLGWESQGDGKWFYGLNIENGRIRDDEEVQLKSAVREICRTLQPGIRLTAHQSLLFTDLAETDRETVNEILDRHHVRRSEATSKVRQWSMACVGLPTCGLAVTDSERALPSIIDELERQVEKLGLERETFIVRMTGCPNGCARPYNSDVGLVGKAKGRYTMYLGGRVPGDRLNFLYKDLVPAEEVVPTLVPLLEYFQQAREPGESFGDFCDRKGAEDLIAWAESHAATT